MQIPGIYVEIKGDASQLKKEITQANEYIKSSATGISNALNNSLSADKISGSIQKLVANFGTLNRAGAVAGKTFDSIGVDLKELTKNTGLTESQLAKLQSQLLKTQASNAQENALKRIASACNMAEKEVRELGAQFGLSAAQINKVVGQTEKASVAFSSLGNYAKGLVGYFSAQQIAQFGKAILDTGIIVDSLNRSLVAIAGSQEGANREFGFLRDTAANTGQSVYDLADAYKKLMASTRDTPLEGQKTRDLFVAVSEAAAVLGMTTEGASLSFKAFSDMASKGTVQAEELKGQLGDNLPGALNIAAKAMGKTTAELMDMMKAGELLASDLLPKMAAEMHSLYGAAANTAALESGRAAVNRLSEAWTDFKSNLYNNEGAVLAINTVAGALNNLKLGFAGFSTEGVIAYNEALASIGKDAEIKEITPYITKKKVASDDSLKKGRDELKKYTQTPAEAMKEKFDGVVKYAQSTDEIDKATAKYNEELANLNKKAASSALVGERKELKQLNAEIKNYADTARDASKAAVDWLSASSRASDDIANLADQYATVGMGEFATGAYEQGKALEEAQKAIEAYSGALETVDAQLAETTAAYQRASSQYEQMQSKFGRNVAGSGMEDQNKLKEQKDLTDELAESVRKLSAEKYALESQKGGAQGLVANIDESYRIERLKSAYGQIGAYTEKIYEVLAKEYAADRDVFIAKTGDKITADKIFKQQMADLDLSNPATSWAKSVEIGLGKVADLSDHTGANIAAAIEKGFASASDALTDFVTTGEADFSKLVDSIVHDMTRIVIQDQISSPLAGAMKTGMTAIAEMFHTGGVVGSEGGSRAVPASTFIGAPRFHSGLMGDEFAAILQKGESVFTKGQTAALGAAIGGKNQAANIDIKVYEAPGTTATVKQSNDGLSIEVIVEQLEGAMSKRMSRGKGLASVLDSRYGRR